MVTPLWPSSSSVVVCFPSTSTRSFSAFFDLKIVGSVKETVEQFKKIGISPINKVYVSITSSTLLINSMSSVAFLLNFVFSSYEPFLPLLSQTPWNLHFGFPQVHQ